MLNGNTVLASTTVASTLLTSSLLMQEVQSAVQIININANDSSILGANTAIVGFSLSDTTNIHTIWFDGLFPGIDDAFNMLSITSTDGLTTYGSSNTPSTDGWAATTGFENLGINGINLVAGDYELVLESIDTITGDLNASGSVFIGLGDTPTTPSSYGVSVWDVQLYNGDTLNFTLEDQTISMYFEGSVIPEPSSIALLTLGCTLLLRRKR